MYLGHEQPLEASGTGRIEQRFAEITPPCVYTHIYLFAGCFSNAIELQRRDIIFDTPSPNVKTMTENYFHFTDGSVTPNLYRYCDKNGT